MRLLCVIDSLGSGGAQRQMVELSLLLKHKGIDVSFLTYYDFDFYKDKLKSASIPVKCINESSYFFRLLKMRRYIRSGNFDCVLSFLETPNFICELAGLPFRKWKLIVGERSANPKIKKSFKGKIFRWLHLFTDYVVTNSYENMSMIREINPLLPDRKCKVIYNIVDAEYWKPLQVDSPIENGKFRLVVAASHQYLKNLKGLVEGINRLPDKYKNKIIVEWYGDERSDSSLIEGKKLISQFGLHNNFVFYPATPYIVSKMQKADAIGLFSFYEGLPNTICEGMTVGKTVICSSVSDMPQILSHNKQLLINPHNPTSITSVLELILSLSQAELIEEGVRNREIAIKMFSKEKVAGEYLHLMH